MRQETRECCDLVIFQVFATVVVSELIGLEDRK